MNRKSKEHRLASKLCPAILAAGMLAGCTTPEPRRANDKPPAPASEAAPNGNEDKAVVGATALWAQKCSQCHYARAPDTFSPTQWEIIMFHMRVRANLTVEEHRRILSLFKPAH